MIRIAKLINHLEAEMEDITQKWMRDIKQINTTDIQNVLQEVITDTPTDSHVVITYLRSSAITECHQFKLAVYQEEPFIDVPIYHTMLNMDSLYTEVPNYAQTLFKQLSPPYFQILSYEKEEIKRNFTVRLYQQSYHILKQAIKEMAIANKQRRVYFGEEMGELITIGEI